MNLKRAAGIGLSLCMIATLIGCAQSAQPVQSGNASADQNSAAVAKTMEEILAEEPNGKRLVLLTNCGGNGRTDTMLAQAKEAGFNIESVELGGGDITARVISEVNNPTGNVVWGPLRSSLLL